MEVLGTIAPTGGFIATLVTIAFLVYKGKLIPGSWVDTLLAQAAVRQASVEADRDHWRKAAETSAEQLSTVLPHLGTVSQVLQALPAPPEETP